MSNLFVKQEKNGRMVLSYRYQKIQQVDEIIMHLLNDGSLDGFIKSSLDCSAGEIDYDITDYVRFNELKGAKMTAKGLGAILKNFSQLLGYLEDSFVNTDYVVYDRECLFVDPRTGKLYLMVLPCEETGMRDDLADAGGYIMRNFSYGNDQAKVDSAQRIVGQGMSSPVDMEKVIEKLCSDEVIETTPKKSMEETVVMSKTAVMQDTLGQRKKTVVPKRQMPCLMRRRTGEVIGLDKCTYILGKSDACCDYVILGNNSVSRIHAIIKYNETEDKYYIIDCNSTNHVFLDGRQIPQEYPAVLRDGVHVHLATEGFIFRLRG